MGCRALVERGELCELVRFSETKHMNEQHERSRKVNSIARNSRISSTQRESNVPMGNSQQKWKFVAGKMTINGNCPLPGLITGGSLCMCFLAFCDVVDNSR